MKTLRYKACLCLLPLLLLLLSACSAPEIFGTANFTPTPAPTQAPVLAPLPLAVTANSVTVQAYPYMLWRTDWNSTLNSFVAADNLSLAVRLPELIKDLPEILYWSDFAAQTEGGICETCLTVYDNNFLVLASDKPLSYLSTLPMGKYYCSLQVTRQGRFISDANQCEQLCTAYLFQLQVNVKYSG